VMRWIKGAGWYRYRFGLLLVLPRFCMWI